MNKPIVIILLLVASALLKTEAASPELPRHILGIRLSMTHEQAKKRLQEIGTFVRNEGEQQEVWQVRNESFSHILIGFDQDDKVRYVTAVARDDKEAKRVEYGQIGDLKKAKQAGDPKINNFNYQWDLPAKKGNPHTLVMALGRDPQFLTTYALKNPDVQKKED